MKKYILMGDNVMSKYDGDTHFVSAEKLCQLYNIPPDQCIFADATRPETYRCYRTEDLIVLYPRYDGDYAKLFGI